MTFRCSFCFYDDETRGSVKGWIEVMGTHLDRQPHPDHIDGLIPCDRLVFEDEGWFAVVDREPVAEGQLKLICKEHIMSLTDLRGTTQEGVDQQVVDSARTNLLDDLIIATEVVKGFDPRVRDVLVIGGATGGHLHFDVIPRYRFDHEGLFGLEELSSMYEDIPLAEKRRFWEARKRHFAEITKQQREVAMDILSSRPGRRRVGLRVGGE
jgi:diadenosine tetraphosphate (Ap4A) HIT family hydrolase